MCASEIINCPNTKIYGCAVPSRFGRWLELGGLNTTTDTMDFDNEQFADIVGHFCMYVEIGMQPFQQVWEDFRVILYLNHDDALILRRWIGNNI